MAQAGYTPIQLYHSTTGGNAPSGANLVNGELAINITDGRLYYKDNSGNVQTLATQAATAGEFVGSSAAGATIKLYEDTDNGTNYVGFQAPASVSSNIVWTLPSADGSSNQVLATDGAGTLSWVNQTGGGGGGGGGTSTTTTQFTATGGQTTFSVAYTVGQIGVYLNGALLASADYTASNGTTVVLAAGATNGDILTVVAYATVSQIKAGDSDVTVTDTGSGQITFTTDGGERMRITSGGLVGIGTNSPNSGARLTLSSGTADAQSISIDSTNTTGGRNGSVIFRGTYGAGGGGLFDAAIVARINEDDANNSNNKQHLAFYTKSGTASPAERMRITSIGQVAINTSGETTYKYKLNVYNYAPSNYVTSSAWGNNNLSIGAYFYNSSNYNPSTVDCPVAIHAVVLNSGSGWTSPSTGAFMVPKGAAFWGQSAGQSGNEGGASFRADVTPYYASAFGYYTRCNYAVTSGSAYGHWIDISGHAFGNPMVGIYLRTLNDGNNTNAAYPIWIVDETTANTRTALRLVRGSTDVGSITTTSSSTAYNTSSDYRLKENVTDLQTGLSKVMEMRPVSFDWKAGGSCVGFIAHELQAVVPEAVSGEKDAYENKGKVDEKGDPVLDAQGNVIVEPDFTKPKYQGVDSSFLVPFLVKAVQELKVELDAAKQRIAALEGK